MVLNILTGKKRGFTLIELLVVLAIIAMLAGLAAPVLFSSMQKSKESALLQDLFIMRKAMDDFFTDNNRYPKDLQELVEKKYIRNIPKDPLTDSSSTWVLLYDEGEDNEGRGVSDVKSSAPGKSQDGESFQDW